MNVRFFFVFCFLLKFLEFFDFFFEFLDFLEVFWFVFYLLFFIVFRIFWGKFLVLGFSFFLGGQMAGLKNKYREIIINGGAPQHMGHAHPKVWIAFCMCVVCGDSGSLRKPGPRELPRPTNEGFLKNT